MLEVRSRKNWFDIDPSNAYNPTAGMSVQESLLPGKRVARCVCMSLNTPLASTEHTLQVYGRHGGVFDAAALMGHHFYVIRAVSSGNDGERAEAVQDRLAKEYFETVEDWDV